MKSRKIKLFKAVSELKDLTEKNGRDNENKDLQEKLNVLIQETVIEEKKLEEDLNFFYDNNATQKKKKKKKKQRKRKIHR